MHHRGCSGHSDIGAVTFHLLGRILPYPGEKQDLCCQVNGSQSKLEILVIPIRMWSNQYRDALGPSVSEKMVEELHLREKVLNDLVSRVLILQEAARWDSDIHDEELRGVIWIHLPFSGQWSIRLTHLLKGFFVWTVVSGEDFERMQRESSCSRSWRIWLNWNGGKVSEEESWRPISSRMNGSSHLPNESPLRSLKPNHCEWGGDKGLFSEHQ